MAPLTFELPVVTLKRHPAEAKGLKSTNSNVETNIKFINRSKQTVKVYWLDFEGKRELRQVLKEGEAYAPKRTFLSHPWLVTDNEDNAWEVYFPDTQPRTVEITGTSNTSR